MCEKVRREREWKWEWLVYTDSYLLPLVHILSIHSLTWCLLCIVLGCVHVRKVMVCVCNASVRPRKARQRKKIATGNAREVLRLAPTFHNSSVFGWMIHGVASERGNAGRGGFWSNKHWWPWRQEPRTEQAATTSSERRVSENYNLEENERIYWLSHWSLASSRYPRKSRLRSPMRQLVARFFSCLSCLLR